MKKILLTVSVLSMLLLVLPTIFAVSPIGNGQFAKPNSNIGIEEKNVAEWIPIVSVQSNILLSYRNVRGNEFVRAKAILRNAKRYTDYTLIYVEFDGYNLIYGGCITSGRTNNNGNLRMKTVQFNYIPLLENIEQKFYVVESKYVNCEYSHLPA